MIAVLTDEYTDYQKLVIDNITQALKRSNIGTLCIAGRELEPLKQFHQSYTVCNSIYTLINEYEVCGIICLSGTLASNVDNAKLIDFLDQFDDLPMVSVGLALPGFTSVVFDHKNAMRKLMEHLILDGSRTKFAFIRGYKDEPYSLEREQIFRSILQTHGHTVDESLFIEGNYDSYDTYNGVYELLSTQADIHAIVAANDDMALSAMRAANSLGLRVPTDCIVTGFDDTIAATQALPALTTVRQPISEMAAKSAELILDQMRKPSNYTLSIENDIMDVYSIDCELIIRGSTLPRSNSDRCQQIQNSAALETRLIESMSGLLEPANFYMNALAVALWSTLTTGSQQLATYFNYILLSPITFNETHWWSNICHQIEDLCSSFQQTSEEGFYTPVALSSLAKIRERVWVVSMNHEFALRRSQNIRTSMQLQMSSCTNFDEMLSTMERWLTSTNAQRSFLVRFINPSSTPSERAELVHAYRYGIEGPCDTNSFASRQILPDTLIGELESGLMVLNPIYAGDTLFGYILLDPRGVDLLHIDSSAQCIGNAMRNQRMIETLKTQTSRLQTANSELVQIANFDELTGLPNRLQFQVQLKHSCKLAVSQGTQVALLFIDLDGFKLINDTLGHSAGDELLKTVADRLKTTVEENVDTEHTIARLGGDEFTILIDLPTKETKILEISQRILEKVAAPFKLESRVVNISASIGIAFYPEDGDDVETLVKHADIAMYKAKEMGKNRMVMYNSDLNVVSETLLQMDHDIREALHSGDLLLHYQPRVDLNTGKICAVEALMRWMIKTPEGYKTRSRPDVFIKVAETTGFITRLDSFALDEACRQAREWELAGYPILIAVNLSVVQLQEDNFVESVESILEKHSVNPTLLELEITESAVMTDVEQNVFKLGQLRKLGIQLSIDDFGTGYSSLNYLKKLPVNNLKIDKSFLSEITHKDGGRSADAAIVRSVVALGKSMDFKLIAEGIETDAQREFVKSLDCEQAQGYFFAKPQSSDDIQTLLIEQSLANKAA